MDVFKRKKGKNLKKGWLWLKRIGKNRKIKGKEKMERKWGKMFRIGNKKEGRKGELEKIKKRGKGKIRKDKRRVENNEGERRKWIWENVKNDKEDEEEKGREWRNILGEVKDWRWWNFREVNESIYWWVNKNYFNEKKGNKRIKWRRKDVKRGNKKNEGWRIRKGIKKNFKYSEDW